MWFTTTISILQSRVCESQRDFVCTVLPLAPPPDSNTYYCIYPAFTGALSVTGEDHDDTTANDL